MEGEINNFIKVWVSIFLSVCYCFAVAKIIPKGRTRVITIFPVICLFLFLPFTLYSIHLGSTTLFAISWLGNFKLLLFAFGKGPLSDPSLSLGHFVALACLPIRIQQNSPPKSQNPLEAAGSPNYQANSEKPLNGHINKENRLLKSSKSGHKSPLNFTAKVLLLCLLMFLSNYREFKHQNIQGFLASIYVYIGLDALLTLVATATQTMLGLKLAPQFNDPYLSTSLQDFWGYRWNLPATDVLRLTIYNPVFRRSIPIFGPKWAFVPAILGTFFVSGIMHELLFYYHCRAWPTWGPMYFFLLHGLLMVIEITLKKTFNWNWQLPQLISGPLIFAFSSITAQWLMLAQLTRFRIVLRGIEEYTAVGKFLKDLYLSISYTL